MEKNRKKKSLRKKLSKKLKQRTYKWHRALAFITMIPLMVWCLSGIMHPFMAHFFKSQIAKEVLENTKIDTAKIKICLTDVLRQHAIDEIKNFRFVSFNKQQYYQVKTKTDELLYFTTHNGAKLENGDRLYAQWLSRYFLDDQQSSITEQTLVSAFTPQYKYVNRYLPVYRISFNRPDAMEIYVDTATNKLATFNPKSRQVFLWLFDTFHNWSFLTVVANDGIRILLMVVLLTVIGLSSLTGILIYGLFWKQFRKLKTDEQSLQWRKYHRQTGLVVALFALMFAFSGAYHVLKKTDAIPLEKMVYEPVFKVSELDSDQIKQLSQRNDFQNVSLVQFKNTVFYRVMFSTADKESEVRYFSKTTVATDFEYAQYLAAFFNAKLKKVAKTCCEMDTATDTDSCQEETIKETASITDFKNRDYGFVNKRLPVVKVAFESDNNKTLFVETATGQLAACVTDSERAEGYSFAVFHKFLFMDWAGKPIRDLTLVLTALGLVLAGVLGLVLLVKRK